MNEQPNIPTAQQRKYLGYLLSRAHERGVRHLPTATLSRQRVSDSIDYLRYSRNTCSAGGTDTPGIPR
jgi:hypothetical protein